MPRYVTKVEESEVKGTPAIAEAETGAIGWGLVETLLVYARCQLAADAYLVDEAERTFRRALSVAQRQGSRIDELRAACDLTEFFLETGDRAAAVSVIKSALEETKGRCLRPDLQRAEALNLAAS